MKIITKSFPLILFAILFSSCLDENADKWELRVENKWSVDLDVYISTNIQTDPFMYLGTVDVDETVNELGYFEYLTTYYLQARDADGLLYDEYIILTKDETVGEFCLWVMEP